MNTAYVPINLMLAQPPCPEPVGRRTAAAFEADLSTPIDAYDVSAKNEEAVLVGTERWCAVELVAKSRARGCWVKMLNEETSGDGGEEKWWPRGVEPWLSVGAWMEDGVFEFAEAVEWKL
jgi:hypothetical protein